MIDPRSYLAALAATGASDAGPLTRCPLCLSELVPVRGAHSASGHLRHKRGANDAACVLTTGAYEPQGLVV